MRQKMTVLRNRIKKHIAKGIKRDMSTIYGVWTTHEQGLLGTKGLGLITEIQEQWYFNGKKTTEQELLIRADRGEIG